MRFLDKILRKIKALKAKLKSSPANRRISVYPICSEPVAHNLASSSCVENMVESHIQEESSEARNLTNFQNVYTEFSYPAADIENVGKEYSNINISASINEIQIPSLTGVNLSDINSIDDIIPPRVEVGFEESAVRPPELITPNANDFGNAELEDILSLGFDQNIISSFGKGKQTNYESTEVLHHSSDLLPRSSMRQDLATPDNLLHGDGLQQSIEKSISRQSLQISTQLSPVNYQILENTSVVLPEYHRTPIALAASSFIIPPFSGIEEDEEYSPTDGPPNEAHSLSNANSRRQLVFNNIQESLPDRALPQRRKRRVQKVNDNCTDILNSVDDIMLLHNILIISESILIIPHKNPSDLK